MDTNFYPPQNNGPHTTIAATINASQTSITVANAAILPDAPNVLTIGTEEDAELVLMESKTGNILAVQRGYNGTTAKAWDSGAWIYRAITAQDVAALQKRQKNYMLRLTAEEYESRTIAQRQQDYADGVRGYLVEGGLDVDSLTDMQKFAAFAHPVGEIVQFDVPTSPATMWGFGTWESLAEGRVLVGAGTADSGTVYTAGQTGGEEKHALTVGEMPSHNHGILRENDGLLQQIGSDGEYAGNYVGFAKTIGPLADNTYSLTYTGNDKPHNIMQPYYVCYMWRRVA